MMRSQKIVCLLVLIAALVMTGCSNNGGNNSTEENNGTNQNQTSEVSPTEEAKQNQDETNGADLTFDTAAYTEGSMTVNGIAVNYRAYENIVYVGNPVDTQYQCMNIYIPEAYFNGDTIGKFTANTAPIFFPNTVGGYMSGEPGTPSMEGSVGGDASRLGLTGDGGINNANNGNMENQNSGNQPNKNQANGNETAGTTEGGTTGTSGVGDAATAGTGDAGSSTAGSGNTGGSNAAAGTAGDEGASVTGSETAGTAITGAGTDNTGTNSAATNSTGSEGVQSGNAEGTDGADQTPNAILMALSKGYVVAAPGARGRTLEADDGTYTGKAPAAIIDLKAAVRYLHYNDAFMPGNANKIISNGTSAGGALSVLLGATGNNAEYDAILAEIGAADADDSIYAVSAYCPITNLDNADMAYEWMFSGINEYTSMNISVENGQVNRQQVANVLSEDQIGYSADLKMAFSDYINGLALKDLDGNDLTLDKNGNGSFKEYVKTFIMESAQAAYEDGVDLSTYSWISVEDGVVTNIDFDGYIRDLSRSKGVPAFDSIDLSSGENSLFGTKLMDTQHFTDFSQERDTSGGSIADEQIIRMMNPMNYIGNSGTDMAQFWRIRHGTRDSDTAAAIPVILSNVIEANGYPVDFYLPWGEGHGGDYDLEELFNWMEEVTS